MLQVLGLFHNECYKINFVVFNKSLQYLDLIEIQGAFITIYIRCKKKFHEFLNIDCKT